MKALILRASIAAASGVLAIGSAAQAQRIPAGGFRSPPPPPPPPPVAFPGVFVIEREVPVIIDRQAPPPPAAVPLSEQAQGGAQSREPWVLGKRYASLPSGCMKLIAGTGRATYYHCSGQWDRQVGEAQYRAVVATL